MSVKNEQEWFKKFYEGTFLVKGWKDRMKEILRVVDPGNKEEMRKSLESLGEKIGREWARDNSVRRIDTAMMKQWGEELLAAKEKGVDALNEKIGKIEAEVIKILL